jgi:cytochrome c oxidase accessory protein FixG
LLVFIAAGAILLLAFCTAIWGRVWCGWACPQTVFVDAVFRRVERWVEGDHLARRKLDESPLSLGKLARKGFKWAIFAGLALVVSHSFLAYFVGTEQLGAMIRQSPAESPASFLVMAGVALVVLFDFGWFREQFCTLVCPYGRFQSVLMDDASRVVAYDLRRGEPRRGARPETESGNRSGPEGACVNCYRCVQVCPTGIDIRRGVQLECISCTACIDACDDVMDRLKRPRGLIRHGSQALAEGRAEGSAFSRPRLWAYASLLAACATGLAFVVARRQPVLLSLQRAVDAPYQEIRDETGRALVINHFKAELRNQTFAERTVDLEVDGEARAAGVTLVVANHWRGLEGGGSERADVFVRFPRSMIREGHASVRLALVSGPVSGTATQSRLEEVRLVGPLF